MAGLNELQTGARFGHPYTCPNRHDGKHHDNGHDLGCLVATEHGWMCPDCDYTQDWAHAGSATLPRAGAMASGLMTRMAAGCNEEDTAGDRGVAGATVDALMQAIPAAWRRRWCGGEAGPCACMGCVQAGMRQQVARKAGDPGQAGDPEHLDEARLRTQARLWAENTFTHAEWAAWMQRHPAGEAGTVSTYDVAEPGQDGGARWD